MTKREFEVASTELGDRLAWVVVRVLYMKIGWWVFGLKAWCGLSLPWGVALFIAALIPNALRDDRPRVRGIPFDKSLH